MHTSSMGYALENRLPSFHYGLGILSRTEERAVLSALSIGVEIGHSMNKRSEPELSALDGLLRPSHVEANF